MSKPTSAPLRLPRGGGTPSGWQALDLKHEPSARRKPDLKLET